MAAEREQELREFTRRLFQDSRDPSTLTPGAVRRRFVAQSGRGSLMPGEKRLLRRLVEAELHTQAEKPRAAAERESSASPSPLPPPESSSNSDDSDREAKSPETKKLRAEDLESPEAKKLSPRHTGSPEDKKPRARDAKKMKANSTDSPEGSVPEGEAGTGGKEREASAEDSSSSSSDENTRPQENTRSHSAAGGKKQKGRLRTGKQEPGDAPEVRRLKRYLRVCGVRPNYRKLLGGCRSRRERVAVLHQELAALGLDGRPSLQRCQEVRLRREQEAEVAALDLGNIIPSHGRPRRRNVWSLYAAPSTPPAPSPPRARPDWSQLRGIISSDEDDSE
ncbi:HIRA-interacting protein 3 [Alligator sinensis]|uniref:HIRA-interacting protein 3 n=1 Tax=Alligator sinensis TaxID=38654 RepID=A0A1U7SBW1_ALLSI|nr:HIRA-interacting protein 3 [Alligator sinensis]